MRQDTPGFQASRDRDEALADTIRTDMAIVGAGIAGAGLAADLAGDFDVVLIEQESRPGYHSTGRSAAIFIQNYGNAAIRALSRASCAAVSRADRDAVSRCRCCRRAACCIVAGADGLAGTQALLAEAEGLRELIARRGAAPWCRCCGREWLRRRGL